MNPPFGYATFLSPLCKPSQNRDLQLRKTGLLQPGALHNCRTAIPIILQLVGRTRKPLPRRQRAAFPLPPIHTLTLLPLPSSVSLRRPSSKLPHFPFHLPQAPPLWNGATPLNFSPPNVLTFCCLPIGSAASGVPSFGPIAAGLRVTSGREV